MLRIMSELWKKYIYDSTYLQVVFAMIDLSLNKHIYINWEIFFKSGPECSMWLKHHICGHHSKGIQLLLLTLQLHIKHVKVVIGTNYAAPP